MNVRLGADQASGYLTLREGGHPVHICLEPLQPDQPSGGTELLAALLAPVLGADAEGVAAALTLSFRSLSAVLAARPDRLAAVPGMSHAAVSLIELVHRITGWTAKEAISERELIGSPAELERFVRARLRCRAVELAYGLFLDRKNRLIADVLLGQGTVDHTPLYPREVVRHAIRLDASAVILVHNHPSGDPTPSRADIDSTDQIARALATIDVALHDHLIVGENEIASLRQLHHL